MASSCVVPSNREEKTKEKPPLPEGWARCHYYLERKGRYCRQQRVGNSKNSDNANTRFIYCGNHQPNDNTEEEAGLPVLKKSRCAQTKRNRKRIPCPVDPSHTIWQDAVEKHVKVCPRAIREAQTIQNNPHCYQRNTNTGGHGPLHKPSPQTTKTVDPKEVAIQILQAFHTLFSSNIKNNVPVQQLSFEDISNGVPLLDLSEPELNAGVAQSVEYHRIKSGGTRHLVQQASLVGHLRRMNCLNTISSKVQSSVTPMQIRTNESVSTDRGMEEGTTSGDIIKLDESGSHKIQDDNVQKRVVVELGAGRGMLGLVVAGAMNAESNLSIQMEDNNKPPVHLMMVERSGSRAKADTRIRMADKRQKDDETPATTNVPTNTGANYLRLKGLCVNRIKCDLSHVDIPSALKEPIQNHPEEKIGKSNLVVVAKHLCGAGTDLALKSLRDLGDIRCCIMATCCHGVCNWNDYVGRQYFVNSLGFGKEEFDLMTRWSAGTVASSSPVSNQESKQASTSTSQSGESPDTKQLVEEHSCLVDDKQDANNISTIVKELDLQCGVQGLGRACQRLIDYGRCDYMRNILFTPTQNSPKGAGEQYTVELCHYVDSSVTPQNAVLMASRESNNDA
eukprot:scaffold63114_cov60-Attheya_sp.AAC.1